MGFDLFMGGLAVVLAALATWLIILFFRSSISDRSPVEAALQGLRNPNNGNDDDHDSDDSAPGAQITDQISRISRLLILAVVLTVIVFIPSLLNRFSTSLVPDWLVNPWLQAIVTTPTMFLCGAPIHREGWHALSRRAPDVNSLISLGATGAFIYSLAICVAGNQFPEGSQHAYFGGVNLIITLALAIELVELLILRDVKQSQDSMNPVTASQQAASATTKASAASSSTMAASTSATGHALADRAFNTLIAGIRKLAHFTRIFVITVIIIAVWAFALLVVFGPQPRLTFALFGGVGVLVVAGFILAILALVLIINGRRKAQRGNIG